MWMFARSHVNHHRSINPISEEDNRGTGRCLVQLRILAVVAACAAGACAQGRGGAGGGSTTGGSTGTPATGTRTPSTTPTATSPLSNSPYPADVPHPILITGKVVIDD